MRDDGIVVEMAVMYFGLESHRTLQVGEVDSHTYSLRREWDRNDSIEMEFPHRQTSCTKWRGVNRDQSARSWMGAQTNVGWHAFSLVLMPSAGGSARAQPAGAQLAKSSIIIPRGKGV